MTDPAGPVAALAMEEVRYGYAGSRRPVLDGVTLHLLPGRVLGLVGGNESGKSTLCLVAAGLAPGSIGGRLEGSVRLSGTDVADMRPHESAQHAGILFQNPQTQLSGTVATVYEEVAFGPRNLGLGIPEIVDRVESALGILGLNALAPRDPMRLSGGQAQLVALASVLAMRPALLVLDEPTSQLDPAGTRLVGAALHDLSATLGTAVLIVEHKTALLAEIADEVVVLDAGKVVRRGPAGEVLADPLLQGLGVDAPAAIRLARAAEARGIVLDPTLLEAGR